MVQPVDSEITHCSKMLASTCRDPAGLPARFVLRLASILMPARHRPACSLPLRITLGILTVGLVCLDASTATALTTVRRVEVTSDSAAIRRLREVDLGRLATVSRGTVLEVVDKSGDWYWILLDPNDFGTRRAGWIAAADVEELPEPTPGPVAEPVGSQEGRSEAEPTRSELPVQEGEGASTIRLPEHLGLEVVVTFRFDSSELSAAATATLDDMVAQMKAGASNASIEVDGHTDSTGSNEYNMNLGLRRAEAVRQYLNEHHGIPLDQMNVVSYGEDSPAAPNDTRDGRAQNRRVVVKL